MKTEKEINDNVFNVDNFIDYNKTYSIQEKLSTKIIGIKEKLQSNKLITNCYINCVICDMRLYKIGEDKIKINKDLKPIPFGKLGDLDIYMDPTMRWDDNRIIFFKDDEEIFTLNIRDTNKILI